MINSDYYDIFDQHLKQGVSNSHTDGLIKIIKRDLDIVGNDSEEKAVP